jgi:3-oxoacyl-[acyl-carrier-protein] synthase II
MRPRSGLRVAVTGVGAVTAWNAGTDALWRGLTSADTAIGPFSRWDHAREATHLAGQAPVPGDSAIEDAGIADRFAIEAVAEALSMAGMDVPAAETGLWLGSSTGGMYESEEWYARVTGRIAGRPRLASLAYQPVSAPAHAVARRFGIAGPVRTVSSACASGTLAVLAALDALRSEDVRVAVACGADSLCRTTYGGFNALRSVDARPSRPFRSDRAGLSLGEGGAALVLEPWDDALDRGARPLAELCGAGASSDAWHMTAPDPEGGGPARALVLALADAGARPDEVDFVNLHGTGTSLNDAAEWNALVRVFGERAREIPATATKASIGHLLGSAGAVEAVATVLCLRERAVHPTAGEPPVDPETPVDLVLGRPRPIGPSALALSLNLAFGGCNAALVLRGAGGS